MIVAGLAYTLARTLRAEGYQESQVVQSASFIKPSQVGFDRKRGVCNAYIYISSSGHACPVVLFASHMQLLQSQGDGITNACIGATPGNCVKWHSKALYTPASFQAVATPKSRSV